MHASNLLATRRGRFLTFGLMYVSEGIPYGFTATAMVAFMRTAGLSLAQIGAFVAALFVPWAFKWAWAPLIDLVTLRRYGGRKAWIVFCTSMMIATLMVTAVIDFVGNFELLLWMIVLNNLFCATQDVAIDSLAVSTLEPEERGRGNGIMFCGQYLGIAMGGGGAIAVFGLFGFNATLVYISGLLTLSLLFVIFFVRDPLTQSPAPPRVTFGDALGAFLRELHTGFMRSGPGPRFGLLLAALPAGAHALAYATLTTMQVDYGLAENEIARLSIYVTVMTALGCLVGGVLGDRFGIRRMLGAYFLLTAVPTLALAFAIAQVGLRDVPFAMLSGCIIAHGLLYGMAFGLRPALFMGVTSPAVAATQFTAFMGLGNVAISIGNYWQGQVGTRFDYSVVLMIDAAIVLLPLAVLPFVKSREETGAMAPSTPEAATAY